MIFLSELNKYIDSLSEPDMNLDIYQIKVGTDVLSNRIPGKKVDGKWQFYGAEEIIRSYMQLKGKAIVSVKITLDYYDEEGGGYTDQYTVSVLYNDVDVLLYNQDIEDAGDFAEYRFLNVGSSAWLMPGTSLIVWFAATEQSADAITHKRDGTTTRTEIQMAHNDCDDWPVNYSDDVEYVDISFKEKPSFKVYMLPDYQNVEQFRSRNMFNILDSVCFPCVVSSDPKTEFEEAQQDNVMQRYNIEHQLEFSVKSPSLPMFMYERILAFCRGRVTQRKEIIGSTAVWRDIIITEYKFSKSNEPNKPISLEMKFKYADTRLNNAVIVI